MKRNLNTNAPRLCPQRKLNTIRDAIIGGLVCLIVLTLFIGALVKYGGQE